MKTTFIVFFSLMIFSACSVSISPPDPILHPTFLANISGKTLYVGEDVLGTFSKDGMTFEYTQIGVNYMLSSSTIASAIYIGNIGNEFEFSSLQFNNVTAENGILIRFDPTGGELTYSFSFINPRP